MWNLLRGPLEKIIVAAISGAVLAVPALDLPQELSWLSGALLAGLLALRTLAERITPE